MKSLKEIGKQLVSLALEGKSIEIVNTLYADDAVSFEAVQGGGPSREISGKANIIEKANWWLENNEIHNVEIKGPFPHGNNKFALFYSYDLTNKQMKNARILLEEIGVYEISNGKVIKEEYFYNVD